MQTITITATTTYPAWAATEEELALATSAPQLIADEDLDALQLQADRAWATCAA